MGAPNCCTLNSSAYRHPICTIIPSFAIPFNSIQFGSSKRIVILLLNYVIWHSCTLYIVQCTQKWTSHIECTPKKRKSLTFDLFGDIWHNLLTNYIDWWIGKDGKHDSQKCSQVHRAQWRQRSVSQNYCAILRAPLLSRSISLSLFPI